jgi:hypothetical protein
MTSGLVVLEGRWFRQYNTSVKSLFDVLADINFDSPHAYYYETFANAESLDAIIKNVCGPRKRKKYLYVGAHGNENYIHGSAKEISRVQFRNSLGATGNSICGIFIGSCLFGSTRNAEFLFNPNNPMPNHIKWVAGYERSVDWIESTVLDLLFWNTLFSYDPNKCTELEMIEYTCQEMSEQAHGLIKKLKFQVFCRTRGASDELRKLFNYN